MCGIVGLWSIGPEPPAEEADVAAAAAAMAHRGPDDAGVWSDRSAGIVLGHRRLSIIDLSDAGHQPMHSASGRWVIVFNGEIYNFADLRAELDPPPHAWRGHSDTEVLLASVERWGVEQTVRRAAGMFAIALFDRTNRELWLARDRLGEKPLYVARIGGRLAFASELKALRLLPGWDGSVDRDALGEFLSYGYVRAPRSIYRDVGKVEPATIVRYGPSGTRSEIRFWSVADALQPAEGEIDVPDDEACDLLADGLRRSIREQLVADVPVGALLSAGLDSSLVVALANEVSSTPVRTFTVGFRETAFDEAPAAGRLARALGTDHTELLVTPDDALDVIPRLGTMFDEPLGDVSQIPTFLVSRLTRQRVTVALTGDGGDELFGGYERYHRLLARWRPGRAGFGWERAAATLVGMLPATLLARATRIGGRRTGMTAERVGRWCTTMTAPDLITSYRSFVRHWPDPVPVVGLGEVAPAHLRGARGKRPVSAIVQLMLEDYGAYLPDDVLLKVDRASMAASLECRAPFLDHRIIELAGRVPPAQRIGTAPGKRLSRRLARRLLPDSVGMEVADGAKRGFGVPVGNWLRGPLRDWGEALLDPAVLRRDGLLDPLAVRRSWDRHLAGHADLGFPLWDALVFQSWRLASR